MTMRVDSTLQTSLFGQPNAGQGDWRLFFCASVNTESRRNIGSHPWSYVLLVA
jgi:hypothetical protein